MDEEGFIFLDDDDLKLLIIKARPILASDGANKGYTINVDVANNFNDSGNPVRPKNFHHMWMNGLKI